MFTGIIESVGVVTQVVRERSNVHFTIASDISDTLKIDQSVSHNGVCLTVVALADGRHTVTAVDETLQRTNLGDWEEGSKVNLERSMQMNGRLDGHIVQGHVDGTTHCIQVLDIGGSWQYTFAMPADAGHLVVDKGSICINGVSLTVVSPDEERFSVAIIPYTYAHTNFHQLMSGSIVNIEFDILGKYISRYLAARFAKE